MVVLASTSNEPVPDRHVRRKRATAPAAGGTHQGDAVGVLEHPAEHGAVAQPPPGPDLGDAQRGQPRVGQVGAAPVEPLLADERADALPVLAEQVVQVAHGDVVRAGDGGRGELIVVQVADDVVADRAAQRVGPCLGGQRPRGVRQPREERAGQRAGRRPQPVQLGRPERTGLLGEPAQERAEQRPGPAARQPPRHERPKRRLRERQCRPGELEQHDPRRLLGGQYGCDERPGRVVDDQVALGVARPAALLLQAQLAAADEPDHPHLRVAVADEPGRAFGPQRREPQCRHRHLAGSEVELPRRGTELRRALAGEPGGHEVAVGHLAPPFEPVRGRQVVAVYVGHRSPVARKVNRLGSPCQ